MLGRKLTALCYGSISAIGNRVTDGNMWTECRDAPAPTRRKSAAKISADVVAVILRMVSIAKMCCVARRAAGANPT